jgi:hypothetical protein
MHKQKCSFFSCSTHFHRNHHTAKNSARRPHNSEPDPPEIQTVSDWTTTPTTLLVGEGPDPGQPVGIRPFSASRAGSGRSVRGTAGSRQSRPFWPGNGRIPSIPAVLARERPDLAMARGFGPFFSGHMMKGIFVFV